MRDVTHDDLTSFFAGLGQVVGIARRAQAQLDLELATRFSPLRYLRPDELGFSRILADLLDANGSHGQGDRFLRKLVDMLELQRPPSGLAASWVGVEHPTPDGRRLDILLEVGAPVDFAIGIENKPWAREQPNQLESYVNYLSRYPNWTLLYITLDARPPTTPDSARCAELIQQGRLHLLSYAKAEDSGQSLQVWLQQCRDTCHAVAVRQFLGDLAAYVEDIGKGPTLGTSLMAERVTQEAAADFIISSPRNLSVCMILRESFDLGVRKLIGTFLDSVEREVQEKLGKGWGTENPFRSNATSLDWLGLTFYRHTWKFDGNEPGGICISTYSLNDFSTYIAIYCSTDEARYDRSQLSAAVEAHFLKPGKPDQWFPIWEHLERPLDDWASREFLLRVLEPDAFGRLVDSLSERLVALARAAAPVFDRASRP
jgi:hypothetical protein